jgi:hypothetical protein
MLQKAQSFEKVQGMPNFKPTLNLMFHLQYGSIHSNFRFFCNFPKFQFFVV